MYVSLIKNDLTLHAIHVTFDSSGNVSVKTHLYVNKMTKHCGEWVICLKWPAVRATDHCHHSRFIPRRRQVWGVFRQVIYVLIYDRIIPWSCSRLKWQTSISAALYLTTKCLKKANKKRKKCLLCSRQNIFMWHWRHLNILTYSEIFHVWA